MGNQYALGYKHTDEAKQKISKANKGISYNKEKLNKFRNSIKNSDKYKNGRVVSAKKLSKRIIRISDGKIYNSIKECKIDNKFGYLSIITECNDINKNQKFKFYIEESGIL